MNILFVNSKFNSYGQYNYSKSLSQSPKLNTLKADTCSFTGIFNRKNKGLEDLVPKHKGLIYEKVKDENGNITEKRPVEVDIVTDKPGDFVFMRDGQKIGEVSLSYISKNNCGDVGRLNKNYEKLGVVGDRIDVNFIQNYDQDKYGGIGHLSDLLEVACCKEMGFSPNVISYSISDAAPVHYLRGKRFIPFEEYDPYYISFYNKQEPDDIVKKIINNTPKGEYFDTTEIKHPLLMYMPKEMVKELEEELKEHPIF